MVSCNFSLNQSIDIKLSICRESRATRASETSNGRIRGKVGRVEVPEGQAPIRREVSENWGIPGCNTGIPLNRHWFINIHKGDVG